MTRPPRHSEGRSSKSGSRSVRDIIAGTSPPEPALTPRGRDDRHAADFERLREGWKRPWREPLAILSAFLEPARRGWARIQGRSKSVVRFGSQGLETSRTFYAASINCSEVEHFALARRPVLILAQPRRAVLQERCPALERKIFRFTISGNQKYCLRIPPRRGARIAIVTKRGAGCGGRVWHQRAICADG
jgi:hypothetical protein